MCKRILILLFVVFATSSLYSQAYVYNFNNDFTEAGAVGPTLTEILEANGACAPLPAAGAFGPQTISSPCGAPTRQVFSFNRGGGVSFDNSTDFIGANYTVSVIFAFTSPGTTYQRIIDFSNGTRDNGLYVGPTNNLEVAGSTVVGAYSFTANTYAMVTVVRDDGAPKLFSAYINGQLYSTLDITPGTDPYLPVASSVINLFTDDQSSPCDEGAGSVLYFSLNPVVSDATQVLADYNALCSTLLLPLHLINFTATKAGSAVQLKWITESEVNTSHFELERSADGRTFTKLTSVNAVNNSASRNNYSYNDASPLPGTGFYRLKIIDIDGHFKYSNVLKITYSGITKFEVFPNPARETVTISGIQGNQMIKLMNAQGVLLTQLRSTGQSMTLDINKYPTGIYIVEYSDGESVQRQKIVKN